MNKEFVLYEEALALKELGFNEPCFGGFYENFSNGDNYLELFNLQKLEHELDTLKGNDDVLAPTYQQAFRWSRDKHKIDKTIDNWAEQPVNDEVWPKAYQYYINGVAYHPYFKTYEEAEFACLKKLIEIIKSKINE
jgi:hypothetical protein